MHAQRLVQKVFTRRYVFLTSATTTIRSTGLIQNWIQKAFSPRYLLLTNTLTCGGLLGVADYVVQKIENRWHGKAGQPVDWGRVRKFTFWVPTLRFSSSDRGGLHLGPDESRMVPLARPERQTRHPRSKSG